jgi:hypothetical protein
MAKKNTLRKDVMSEIKITLPKHNKGEYLEKFSEEVIKEREAAWELRKKELEEVEKAIRDKQVKFLATESELDEIKKSAHLDHKSQSEFIRSAIWEKISSLELKYIIPPQKARAEEEGFKESLKIIKESLKEIKKLERKALKRLSGLEMQERDIKGELEAIKERLTRLEAKETK